MRISSDDWLFSNWCHKHVCADKTARVVDACRYTAATATSTHGVRTIANTSATTRVNCLASRICGDCATGTMYEELTLQFIDLLLVIANYFVIGTFLMQ